MGYLNLVGSFIYKEPLFRAKLQALADNDAQLKIDGWAVSTKIVFYQAAVPTGWTQDTSQNDKALRIVGSTGGGGSGGTQALSATISLAHTHAITAGGSHLHPYADHTHAAGTPQTCGLNTDLISDNNGAGVMRRSLTVASSGPYTSLSGTLLSPGALTLGLSDNHDHSGVTDSSLTDFVFAYCDAIVGTKNALSGTYTDLTSQWHTGDKIDFDPFSQLAGNDAYSHGALMPASAIVLFGQPAAPDGWSKISTTNDRILRVVSGTGAGSGGTQSILAGVILNHSNNVAIDPDHTHTVPNHQHQFGTSGPAQDETSPFVTASAQYVQESVAGNHLAVSAVSGATATRTVYKTQTTVSGGGNTDPGGAHTHALVSSLTDFIMAYVDVIQCSKDSSGSPYSYVDYTAEFAWKKLVTYQRLNQLAKNDEYNHFHTTPSGSQAFFFMASPPTGWVKNTSQHDKALRIVSGATGGSVGGGSHLVSDTIMLAHTHTIPTSDDHTHTNSHLHALDTTTATATAPTNNFMQFQRSFFSFQSIMQSFSPSGGDGIASSVDKTTQPSNDTTGLAGAHNHGGVTDSQLTDVQLAYADVIWCTKT